MTKKIERPWGCEETIACTSEYIVKKFFINAGAKLERQFHLKCEESIYVDHGVLHLDLSETEDESNILKINSGDSWRMLPRKTYRFCAPQNTNVVLFIITTPDEADLFYFENSTRRINAKI